MPVSGSPCVLADYTLSSLPSPQAGEFRYLLEANDNDLALGSSRNYREEAELMASFFSVCSKNVFRVESVSLSGLDHHIDMVNDRDQAVAGVKTANWLIDVQNHINRLQNIELSAGRQYFRAFRCMRTAIENLDIDPTLASLFLVIAAECLSSQDFAVPFDHIHPDGNTAERYCYFLSKFASRKTLARASTNSDQIKKIFKTAYFAHRSAIAHSGREVSLAVKIADQLDLPYVMHGDYDNKERPSPGNKWLLAVTQEALLNSLMDGSVGSCNSRNVREIASDLGTVKLRVNRSIKKGEVVSVKDLLLSHDDQNPPAAGG